MNSLTWIPCRIVVWVIQSRRLNQSTVKLVGARLFFVAHVTVMRILPETWWESCEFLEHWRNLRQSRWCYHHEAHLLGAMGSLSTYLGGSRIWEVTKIPRAKMLFGEYFLWTGDPLPNLEKVYVVFVIRCVEALVLSCTIPMLHLSNMLSSKPMHLW